MAIRLASLLAHGSDTSDPGRGVRLPGCRAGGHRPPAIRSPRRRADATPTIPSHRMNFLNHAMEACSTTDLCAGNPCASFANIIS
jgi:hypothetical protein